MSRHPSQPSLPRVQRLTEKTLATLERFLHVEAVSGIVLLIAAVVALIWANSPLADSYQDIWNTSLSFGIGGLEFSHTLKFWINDALMTVFFLVVGMEIRHEIYSGALSSFRQASLPIAAAIGGVVVPALIYLAFNTDAVRQYGWAVPTATDIAFAVGVLALLGRSIPSNVRVLLLAIAIIDDIVAVLIIALFYSGGLDYTGFLVASIGIALVLALQQMGIGLTFAYVIPGAIIWVGILITGAHPTLAGVVLGLMTPVIPMRMRERPQVLLSRAVAELSARDTAVEPQSQQLDQPLRQIRRAQRELLPPVVRVQSMLHPWVAYSVMPLFALANAGVSLDGITLNAGGAQWVVVGIILALVLGKPIGVVGMSWAMVRLGLCRLPQGVSWGGIWLISLLAGIGFTMSIFIAMLAFEDATLLGAGKLGVLIGSLVAATLSIAWGVIYTRRQKNLACIATH